MREAFYVSNGKFSQMSLVVGGKQAIYRTVSMVPFLYKKRRKIRNKRKEIRHSADRMMTS